MKAIFDTLLDRSLVGGYGAPGMAIRRRLFGWSDWLPRLDGKVVVVTGAGAGIGFAAAQGFAELGARVFAVVRNGERAQQAFGQADGIEIVHCDVSSLASLRQFVGSFIEPIDVLVNNAGVMVQQREQSVDGIELTFATNVLGPFVLTRDLRFAEHARVITVSSGGAYGQKLAADDLFSEHDYAAVAVYAKSKRAEIVLMEQFAQRDPAKTYSSMHPGWAATPGVAESLPTFQKLMRPILRSPAQGADTILWLGATADPIESGRFWHDRRARTPHYTPRTRESDDDRATLWATCERLASG